MQIYGPSHVHGSASPKGPHASRSASMTSAARSQPTDEVAISPAAEAAVQAAELGDVRAELVARVRHEIATGTYETPDKLDSALERLLDAIG